MNEDTLHELPKGWGTATINQLVDKNGVFIDGDWIESKDQDPSGDVRLVQLADIGDGVYRNKSNRFLTFEKAVQLGCTILKIDDVLIARMPDPLGRACLFPGDPKPCITVVDVCIVRLSSNLTNNHWLMHAINSPAFRSEIANLQSGSTRMRISRGNLAKLELPLPPLPEQRLIATRVDSLLEHVRKAKESLEKTPQIMKRFRQAALKKAFAGELTAEWREQQQDLEPAAELVKRIQEERRHRYEEEVRWAKAEGRKLPKKQKETEPLNTSDLPELPEKWCWASLPQMGELARGKSMHRPRDDERLFGGPYPFIQTGDVANSKGMIKSFSQTYSEFGLAQSRLWPAGTLCITIAANIAATGLLMFPSCFPDSIVGFIPDKGYCDAKFFEFFIRTAKNELEMYAPATAQKNINLNILYKLAVPLPPLPEQQEIVRRIESLFKFADETEKNAVEARKRVEIMTQSILARAFRGDLSADFREAVKNWEDLDAEARGRYVFVLPEEEREKVLYADEFPMEPASRLLERIGDERAKLEGGKRNTKARVRKG